MRMDGLTNTIEYAKVCQYASSYNINIILLVGWHDLRTFPRVRFLGLDTGNQ